MNNVRLYITARGIGDTFHEIEVISLRDGTRRAVGLQDNFSRYQFKAAVQDTYPDAQINIYANGEYWIADIEVAE